MTMSEANCTSSNKPTSRVLNLPGGFAGAVLTGFLLTATLACAEHPPVVNELLGKVIIVADGDTVTVLVNKE